MAYKRFYTAEVKLDDAVKHENMVIPFPSGGEIIGITSSDSIIHVGITYPGDNLVLSESVILKVVPDGKPFDTEKIIFDDVIFSSKYGSLYILIKGL